MKLSEWRKINGKTQEWVAGRMGLTLNTVARHETGKRFPEPAVVVEYYRLTRGAVQPNDWYDLPDLNAVLPMSAAA